MFKQRMPQNIYSSQNKVVKNLFIRKENEITIKKSYCLSLIVKRKLFYETFKELRGKKESTKSLNLWKVDAEHFNDHFANIGAAFS